MISKTVKIIDNLGMHARPSSVVAQEAAKYQSEITIKFKDKKANLKSIMSIMALVVKTNEEITIVAEGSDENSALENILKVMKEKNLI